MESGTSAVAFINRNSSRSNLTRKAECTAFLERRLDDALLSLLTHRGTWSFVQAPLDRHELFPAARTRDMRTRLIDLLPRAATTAELTALLGGMRSVLRTYDGIDLIAAPNDARFLALLDGRYTLEEAIDLAGAPVDRALAAATAYTLFGFATRLDPAPAIRAPLERALPALDPAPPPPIAPATAPPTATATAPTPATAAPSPSPAPQAATAREARPPLETRTEREPSSGLERAHEPEPPILLPAAALPSAPPRASLRPSSFPRAWISESDRADRERELRAYAEVVRTSDYFTILGVDPTAAADAIAAAHRRLRRSLRAEDFQKNPELYGLAREVLRSIDEAWDVLSVPELRAAYQQHLKPHTRH